MPEILSATQKAERKLAEALKGFLPEALEWKDMGGYPILCHKVFLGLFKNVAFFSSGQKITILSKRWKKAILEVLQKYKDSGGPTIEVILGFDESKKFNKGDRYAN
jgi:hypothetical protein